LLHPRLFDQRGSWIGAGHDASEAKKRASQLIGEMVNEEPIIADWAFVGEWAEVDAPTSPPVDHHAHSIRARAKWSRAEAANEANGLKQSASRRSDERRERESRMSPDEFAPSKRRSSARERKGGHSWPRSATHGGDDSPG
jgi:hypothetical protein